ncbi:PAS domain-containing sensor histidine kinase [Psychroserpens sp. SPM9]|uniref:sensor histidine kinase n=1 Tax=Psychroserpens sp. SPM9 TaxID=2975598 RepID=UPI0021A40A4C|nr:PAS domain-containing sensor histidine kinase [Psychroserpens sp. SPM9]MDG5491415.1 PAS domain-containing sensor histidine kinase [Psychroserpens sp. SPM9]
MLWKKIKSLKSGTSNNQENENQLDQLKWKIALENSEVGQWDYNVEKDVVFYSKESKHILGYNDHELSNSPIEWNKRVHPEDLERYFKDFNAHINGLLEVYRNEHRVLCNDGTYKWILDKGKIVERDAKGKPKRIIGTHTDITYRKKQDEQSEKHLQLITSQNKRLHNFTHIVSHNLKTHIGNFKNILEFYEEADSESEKAELIEHLNTISETLTSTIIDLDDIINIKSKSETNELNERVHLFNCAEKVINSLEIEIANNEVAIYNSIRQDDFLVANRSYLESILHNLISNGIKYKSEERHSKVILQSIHTKNELKILVSDNGIGIDTQKFKNQLFEMYQTFHGTDRKDSRGIGLYITKTQIEAIGGSINVESKLNEGTTFILSFKKQKAL